MKLEVSITHFRAMLLEASEIGAMKVLIETGNLSAFISKSQAYATYGRGHVDRWVREELIHLIKDGDANHKVRISRIEIEATYLASNRVSFFKRSYKNTPRGSRKTDEA